MKRNSKMYAAILAVLSAHDPVSLSCDQIFAALPGVTDKEWQRRFLSDLIYLHLVTSQGRFFFITIAGKTYLRDELSAELKRAHFHIELKARSQNFPARMLKSQKPKAGVS